MAAPSSTVELRKALFYHKLPAEIDNRISECVAQDEDLSSAVRTFWSLSLTSRDFHEQFNAFLYQIHELEIRKKSRERRETLIRIVSMPGDSAMKTVAKTGNMHTFSQVLKYAPGLCKLKHIRLALYHRHVQIAERLLEPETMRAKLIKHKASRKNPIALVVRLGLTDLVSRMLDICGPVSLDFPGGSLLSGSSILSTACKTGNVDLVRLLLEQDPDRPWAATRDSIKRAAISALNDVILEDENRREFLGVGAWVGRAGSYDVAKLLLNSHPELAQEDWLLLVAVSSGQQCMFDLLLSHGAKIPTDQIRVDELLHQAICCGSVPLVQTLLANGADARSICLPTDGGDQLSAIQCAALSKAFHKMPTSVPIVEELLKHGVTVGTPVSSALSDNIKDKSPLRIALEVNDVPLVKYLLNVNAHMAEGEHGLMGSVRSVEVLKVLQQVGMDINEYYYGEDDNRCRYLPIIDVARNSKVSRQEENEIFRYFVDHVADINATDASGRTVLHHCCEVDMYVKDHGLTRISYLLNRGANLLLADGAGRTPFHIAARYGTHSALEELKERGADPHAKDHEGRTPLHHIWEEDANDGRGYMDRSFLMSKLEFLLLECMSDPDAQAEDGTYAVHIPAGKHLSPSEIGHILAIYAQARFPNQCPTQYYYLQKCRGCALGWSNRHEETLTPDQARDILNRYDSHGQLFLVQTLVRESNFYLWADRHNLHELIELGMDVNQAQKDGQTVLLTPIALGNPVIRRFLIEAGSNVNYMNDNGDTMLDLMQEYSNEFLTLLESQVDNELNLSSWGQVIKDLRQRGARWGWEVRGEESPQI